MEWGISKPEYLRKAWSQTGISLLFYFPMPFTLPGILGKFNQMYSRWTKIVDQRIICGGPCHFILEPLGYPRPSVGGVWEGYKVIGNTRWLAQLSFPDTETTCDPLFSSPINIFTEIFQTYLVGSTLPETDRHSFNVMTHCSSSHVSWKRLKHTLSFWFISFFDRSYHVLYFHCTGWSELFCVNCSRGLRGDHRCGGSTWRKTWNIAISFSFSTLVLPFRAVPRVRGSHLDFWSYKQSD